MYSYYQLPLILVKITYGIYTYGDILQLAWCVADKSGLLVSAFGSLAKKNNRNKIIIIEYTGVESSVMGDFLLVDVY